MKRTCKIWIFTLWLAAAMPLQVRAADFLIPGGQLVGLELGDDSVTVAAYDDTLGSTARNAGLKIGDEILEIDGKMIDCAQDVRNALDACVGKLEILVRRGGKNHTLHIAPADTAEGPRLGVYLKQGIAGIGTVTYYDPDTGSFGALGHGVSNSKGSLLQMRRGSVYAAKILSVQRGTSGTPGQLKGSSESPKAIGVLTQNTPQGVFGRITELVSGQPVAVGSWTEVHTGPATIRSTVSGSSVREYSVEILKIYPQDRSDGRNLLLKITDPDLLAATGGIVQGMSGSPILQNGKLVGAVTHVLVNDPTRGYGIFIENMLEAAE